MEKITAIFLFDPERKSILDNVQSHAWPSYKKKKQRTKEHALEMNPQAF